MIHLSLLQCRHTDTPLGTMAMAASARGWVRLWFAGQQHFPTNGPSAATDHIASPTQPPESKPDLSPPAAQHLDDNETPLRQHCQGQLKAFSRHWDRLCGTAFQREVWALLRDIACGTTYSYGQLAQALGKPGASRAVGAAVGQNPLSAVIPCHRVVGAQGQLTGYAGCVDRKRALLTLEARA